MSRILVVEDEQHLAEGLRFNLEAEGYRVEVVETGEAALGLLLGPKQPSGNDQGFDIVVLDGHAPGQKRVRSCVGDAPGRAVCSDSDPHGSTRGHSDDVLQGFACRG